ncbi:hypothetical protein BU26DRAFT_276091 [Trematosphaeria pertusa]|uniref:Uncharacterized protein n=1 Tax=Trematosphaeria pertusa TaxID=390896 RepID=A0A6A6IMM4_9PLEO|nr:uncharacterized protein BU26DRAFT_276091 [Trematosphaeria pertusa]KAF2251082.1 hypothetical protein BU26DRAFT_276091 [Trematosphaeria pertusa]
MEDVPQRPPTEAELHDAEERFWSGRQTDENPRGWTEEQLVAAAEEEASSAATNGAKEEDKVHEREEATLEEVDLGLDIGSEEGDFDSGVDVGIPASPQSPNRKAKSAEAENEKLKKRLADLEDLLADERANRQRAEKEAQDRYREARALKRELKNPKDTYPYSFWPATPWNRDPDREELPQPPQLWKKNNPHPVIKEHYAREGVRQYEERENEWKRKRNANRVAWMRSRPHMWPTDDESRWHGVRFLGQGSYGSAGLWVRVDDTNTIIDVSLTRTC